MDLISIFLSFCYESYFTQISRILPDILLLFQMPLFSTFPVNDVIHTVSAVVFLADIVPARFHPGLSHAYQHREGFDHDLIFLLQARILSVCTSRIHIREGVIHNGTRNHTCFPERQ
jgi:hypothetical protein